MDVRLIKYFSKNRIRTLSKARTMKCLICTLDFLVEYHSPRATNIFFYIPTISFPLINNFQSTVQVFFFFFFSNLRG